MKLNQKTTSKESKMTITPSNLTRWAGLAALVGGTLFVVIQPIHPPQIIASATTGAWSIVHYVSLVMSILLLLGITGIYARQVKESGWLGLIGFLLLFVEWVFVAAVDVFEAMFLPVLATQAPKFAAGFLGIFGNYASEVNLGAIPLLNPLSFVLYLLGGVLFGIATLRAGILSRWAAILLAVGAPSTLLFALLPHELERIAAVPVGIAIAWLGYSLWSERRVQVAERVTETVSARLGQSAAE